MKLPGQRLEGMQVESKSTHFRFRPVNDANEMKGCFVDYNVAGAQVSVEGIHRKRRNVVHRINAGLDERLESGGKRTIQGPEVPDVDLAQIRAVLRADWLRCFPRQGEEAAKSQSVARLKMFTVKTYCAISPTRFRRQTRFSEEFFGKSCSRMKSRGVIPRIRLIRYT